MKMEYATVYWEQKASSGWQAFKKLVKVMSTYRDVPIFSYVLE
jgi:hypothetical protein